MPALSPTPIDLRIINIKYTTQMDIFSLEEDTGSEQAF
jgi:hypothetical protein